MRFFLTRHTLLQCLVAVGLIFNLAWVQARPTPADQDAFAFATALKRGINLGNFFDAPIEGYWGMTYDEALFDRIVEAGFTTVRIPTRWSNHTSATAPFVIKPEFMARMESVIQAALKRKLKVVVDLHHYRQLNGEKIDEAEIPVENRVIDARFYAIWRQVAERFKDYPETLAFEPMNEPHNRLDAAKWNTMFETVRKIIRASNPKRFIVVGPSQWSNAVALPTLLLNETDRRLIVTIHHYDPFEFTHQGASWTTIDSKKFLGTKCCSQEQVRQMDQALKLAADWSKQHQRPIWVGEWGSFNTAALEHRLVYTSTMVKLLKQYQFSWAYWELASNFGIWDPKANAWRAPLKAALMDTK